MPEMQDGINPFRFYDVFNTLLPDNFLCKVNQDEKCMDLFYKDKIFSKLPFKILATCDPSSIVTACGVFGMKSMGLYIQHLEEKIKKLEGV